MLVFLRLCQKHPLILSAVMQSLAASLEMTFCLMLFWILILHQTLTHTLKEIFFLKISLF